MSGTIEKFSTEDINKTLLTNRRSSIKEGRKSIEDAEERVRERKERGELSHQEQIQQIQNQLKEREQQEQANSQSYTPSAWKKSELKQIYVDRILAAGRELKKGHPERVLNRFRGHVPNEELYRYLKHADLEPGTYIDLGAGGGNFTQALGKLIGWDDPKTKIYATDRDATALEKLRAIASENDKVKPLEGDYTEEGYFKSLKDDGISDVNCILWANNGHYYSSEDRVKFMKEMRSLLKAGGKLLIVEYNTFKQHGENGMYNLHPLPKKQLRIELEQAGFENVKILQNLPSNDQYMMYSAVATFGSSSQNS